MRPEQDDEQGGRFVGRFDLADCKSLAWIKIVTEYECKVAMKNRVRSALPLICAERAFDYYAQCMSEKW